MVYRVEGIYLSIVPLSAIGPLCVHSLSVLQWDSQGDFPLQFGSLHFHTVILKVDKTKCTMSRGHNSCSFGGRCCPKQAPTGRKKIYMSRNLSSSISQDWTSRRSISFRCLFSLGISSHFTAVSYFCFFGFTLWDGFCILQKCTVLYVTILQFPILGFSKWAVWTHCSDPNEDIPQIIVCIICIVLFQYCRGQLEHTYTPTVRRKLVFTDTLQGLKPLYYYSFSVSKSSPWCISCIYLGVYLANL